MIKKTLLSKSIIIKYILNLLFFVLIIGGTSYSIIEKINSEKIKNNINIIRQVKHINEHNLKLICLLTNCRYIEYNNNLYKYEHESLIKTSNIDKDQICKTLNINKLKIYLAKTSIFNDIKDVLIVDFLIFFITYTGIFTRMTYVSIKNSKISDKMHKLELESKLHTTVTEFAHHEMSLPVAIIKTLIMDIFVTKYPCVFNNDMVCRRNISDEKCKKCKHNKSEQALVDLDYYNRIMLSIERLEVVLNQMSETKNIKYSNGNISITKIIETAVSGINKIAIGKIKLELVNRELMDKYAVSSLLTNGVFLNMINNHINNSKEAKADKVIITAKLCDNPNMMFITIKDNGLGIRDKYDNLIQTTKVFNPGYSTKDQNGDNIVEKKTWLDKIKSFFNIEDESRSIRGIGLYVNREILRKVGGDIILIKTDKNGTTFGLTIPIKIRQDDKTTY